MAVLCEPQSCCSNLLVSMLLKAVLPCSAKQVPIW